MSNLPIKEYALAETALQSARKFSADKLSPDLYLKAMGFYKRGAVWYNKQNYEEAQLAFESAVNLAEKAELRARLQTIKEQL